MLRLPLAFALALALAAPAAAQWPTTEWTILDEATDYAAPVGERRVFADKHERVLEAASAWFSGLGFPRPFQRTRSEDFIVEAGEPYVAYLKKDTEVTSSSHSTAGWMFLTTNPGFLAVDTPLWRLMEASAVHEVYHGIQKGSSPSLVAYLDSRPPTNAACPDDSDVDWLVEGTAAMIQIRWLEAQGGFRYGHPFEGSTRAAWIREFDQSMVRGSIPAAYLSSQLPDPTRRVSWACDYGTWYFWYAVGEMIGRTEAEKVTYTQYLFNGVEPWTDGGVANADIGLKAAAAAYDAITPYRGGLYDLYPEFVAQYLTDDRFYRDLETVELGAPGLYETTSSLSGGPLDPLAARAWRVRVQLPADAGTTPIPYAVRVTLDAGGSTDRDALHLIVGEDVAGRPSGDATPYTALVRTDETPRAADGTIEVLVRVVNVAEAAEATEDAEFSLRIEVDGFYGEAPTGGPTAGEVGGELPPGFVVAGPGPWACEGGARSRAVFDLMTPDEVGRDLDRMIPEMTQDVSDMMDDLEIMLQQMERQGAAAGMSPAQIAEIRREAEAQMADLRAEAQPELDQAAVDVRARRVTQLLATFVGQTDGAECQMTLDATLAGREGGAQMLPGAADADRYPEDEAPAFGIAVFPPAFLEVLRGGAATPGPMGARPSGRGALRDPLDGWEVCTMTDEGRRRARDVAAETGCPAVLCTAGQLVLERAEQNRIAGSFQFEVIKWPEVYSGQCRVPQRDTVTGHFNVASTDDGFDDNSLSGTGGVGRFGGGPPVMPGMPIVLPAVRD